MKVHEYQAAEILRSHGIPTPRGYLVEQKDRIAEVITKVRKDFNTEAVVIKAQIHAGGRGKGGGVQYCANYDDALKTAERILGMDLVTPQTSPSGQKVHKILVTEAIDIEKELYISITLDRGKSQHVIIASAEGGVEIEEVARVSPEKIIKEWVDPVFGLQSFQAYKIALSLGFSGDLLKSAIALISNLYKAYVATDASLAEINPLVITKQSQLIALDAKFNFDDNALYRRTDIGAMRDVYEENPTEVEASKFNLNYIKLDGNVGCMVNGAGLAMATMDIIKLKGGEPANFLDVGGGANVETVKNGFRIILSDPTVTAVLINIFGGIVRCDRVANGVVAAVKELNLKVPVVVRLEGTNSIEAKKILADSGVSILPASTLDNAAEKVVEVAISQR